MGPKASDLVIVSRTLVDLADFLRRRQEVAGRGRVILDRRVGDRRVETLTVEQNRRRNDRRQAASSGVEALMRVLGFTIVPSPASSGDAASPPAVGRPRHASRPAARSRRPAPARRPRRRR